VVAAISWQGSGVVSVADNRGNTYATATSAYDATTGQSLAGVYASDVSGGSTTVTASFSGAAPTSQRLQILEYAGIAAAGPVDATSMNAANGTTAANAVTTGSAATTVSPPVSNGTHTLTAQARDAAGNTTTSTGRTVTVSNADTTAPIITNVNAPTITASTATFTWTTNEAADSEVEYGPTTTYGGFSTLDVIRVTSHSVLLSGLAPSSTYHYRVRSRDAAGNLGLSGDFTFTTLEGVAPAVAITAPSSGATVSSVVTVTASASDNVGVAGVQFKLDGAPLGSEDTTAPYAVSWNTSGRAPGPAVLTATARDAAGNQATSSPVTVTVAGAQVELAWDANTAPNIVGYKIYVGTASHSYSTNVDVGNVTGYLLTGLPTGVQYFFAVTAYDTAGLESGFSNEVNAIK
jgi:hypothetical protein